MQCAMVYELAGWRVIALAGLQVWNTFSSLLHLVDKRCWRHTVSFDCGCTAVQSDFFLRWHLYILYLSYFCFIPKWRRTRPTVNQHDTNNIQFSTACVHSKQALQHQRSKFIHQGHQTSQIPHMMTGNNRSVQQNFNNTNSANLQSWEYTLQLGCFLQQHHDCLWWGPH